MILGTWAYFNTKYWAIQKANKYKGFITIPDIVYNFHANTKKSLDLSILLIKIVDNLIKPELK